MPPLPSPGKVIKMEVMYHNEDSKAVNLFHIAYTGTQPTISDLTNLYDAIAASLLYIYDHNGVASLIIDLVRLIDLDSDTGNEFQFAPSNLGTLTGDVLSSNNAVVVSHEILRRYRGGHPRSYFMLGSATTLEGSSTNQWQASFLTNVSNDFDSFKAAVNGYSSGGQGQCTLVNVSYRSGNAIRVTPVVDVIVSSIGRARVCSQRRRLGKVNA